MSETLLFEQTLFKCHVTHLTVVHVILVSNPGVIGILMVIYCFIMTTSMKSLLLILTLPSLQSYLKVIYINEELISNKNEFGAAVWPTLKGIMGIGHSFFHI